MTQAHTRWPQSNSDMSARIRAHDWSSTSLGPIDVWPARLMTLVEIMLASPLATLTACGPDHILLYNDAATGVLGRHHPAALARPARDGFADVWRTIAPLFDRAAAGESVVTEGTCLNLSRDAEPAMFDVYLTPVRDESGDVRWLQVACVDVTQRLKTEAVLRDREARQTFLVGLGDSLRMLTEPEEIMRVACEALGKHLGVGLVMYSVVGADEETAEVAALYNDGRFPEVPVGSRIRLDDYGPGWGQALRAGTDVFAQDTAADSRGLMKIEPNALEIRAGTAVPLLKDGRLVGYLAAAHTEPRSWTENERQLHREVVERTWGAVERARAQAALRASEEEYRSLFATMDEGFAVCELVRDANGRPTDVRYLDLNHALEAQTGLTHDQVVGRLLSEIFVGRDFSWWLATFTRVVEHAEPVRFEHHIAALDRWFDMSAFPRGGDRFAVLYDDITERKRREMKAAFLSEIDQEIARLSGAEEILRVVGDCMTRHFAASRLAMVEVDEERDLVRGVYDSREPTLIHDLWVRPLSNYVSEEQLQLSRAGRVIAVDDVHTDSRFAGWSAAYQRWGVRAQMLAPYVTGDRLRFVIAVHRGEPHHWRQDEVDLLQELSARIYPQLERARALAALRASEERLRVLVNSIRDFAILTLDPDGRITSWNSGAAFVFGYSADEAIGEHTAIIFSEEDRARGVPAAEMRRAADTGRTEDERWHVDKSGRRLYVNSVMTPLRPEGVLTGYVKVARDLTERKRLEDALRQAHNDLEARVHQRTLEIKALLKQLVTVQEEERRRLARDLHDDIGQKLTALHLKLDALKLAVPSEDWRQRFRETQDFVLQLDRDLRDFAGELRSSVLYTFGLIPALRDLVDMFTQTYGVPVSLEVVGLTQERLRRDVEIHLYRIAQEALTNAHKHARATHIDVFVQQRNQHVILTVTDDGVGFRPDGVQKGSTGMGLVGMRERAALLGGHVEVESASGQGTSVIVSVPTTPEDMWSSA